VPHTLVIRQIDGSDPPRFEVARVRGADVKVADAVEVPPPDTLAVEGLPDGSFPRELRWYLERFLEYPFPPDTERAERLLAWPGRRRACGGFAPRCWSLTDAERFGIVRRRELSAGGDALARDFDLPAPALHEAVADAVGVRHPAETDRAAQRVTVGA